MSATITLNWDKGTAFQSIAELPEKMREAAVEALGECADFMVIYWKSIAPVDTGTYQRSVRKQQSHDVVRVIAGGHTYINPKTNYYCDYAVFLEARYHCGEQAYASIQNLVLQLIRDRVVQSVSK